MLLKLLSLAFREICSYHGYHLNMSGLFPSVKKSDYSPSAPLLSAFHLWFAFSYTFFCFRFKAIPVLSELKCITIDCVRDQFSHGLVKPWQRETCLTTETLYRKWCNWPGDLISLKMSSYMHTCFYSANVLKLINLCACDVLLFIQCNPVTLWLTV